LVGRHSRDRASIAESRVTQREEVWDARGLSEPAGQERDTSACLRVERNIESVRTPDGSTVRVDRSGIVRDRNRSDASTLRDGAVGAALGAIIGAIAGGGKGAAIGAVVGGAGTIIIEGRDDLSLPAGTYGLRLSFRKRKGALSRPLSCCRIRRTVDD
jgi:hypothetical protein